MKSSFIFYVCTLIFSTPAFSQATALTTTEKWTCELDIAIDSERAKNLLAIDLSVNNQTEMTITDQQLSALTIGGTAITSDQILQFDPMDWKQRTVATWMNPTNGQMAQFVLFQTDKKARLQLTEEDLTEDLLTFKNCTQIKQ